MHVSKLAAITFDNSKHIEINLVDLTLAVLKQTTNTLTFLTIWLVGIVYAICIYKCASMYPICIYEQSCVSNFKQKLSDFR